MLMLAAGLGVTYRVITQGLQRVPFTKRRHLILLPARIERMVGEMSFAELLAHGMDGGRKPSVRRPGDADTQLVRGIGERLTKALGELDQATTPGHLDHLRGNQWTFVVVEDPVVNACALPGGKVVVYTGLLDLCRRNRDELAAVVAHEVGHVIARHSAERMGMQWLVLIFGSVLAGWLVSRMRQQRLASFDIDLTLYDNKGAASYIWKHATKSFEVLAKPQASSHPFSRPKARPSTPEVGSVVCTSAGERVGVVVCKGKPGSRNAHLELLPVKSVGDEVDSANPPQMFFLNEKESYILALAGFCSNPRQSATRDVSGVGMNNDAREVVNYAAHQQEEAVSRAVRIASKFMIELPGSRRNELEADMIGMKLMGLAGYDMEKAPVVFAKMEAASGSSSAVTGFLSTHPPDSLRVQTLRNELDAMKLRSKGSGNRQEVCKEVLVDFSPYWALR